MSKLKLLSVAINNNYQEYGDQLALTVTWQNIGDTEPNFNALIAVDIDFCDRQRIDLASNKFFHFKWQPFPSTDMWKPGEIWTTEGLWKLPRTWGGSYKLTLSLVGEDGKKIAFEGSNGIITYSQFISEIDIGWGWGRKRLLEQRKPVFIQFNESKDSQITYSAEAIEFNGYRLNKSYPSICGYKDEKWHDFPSKLTIRRIKDNKTFTYKGDNGVNYKLSSVSDNLCVYTAKTEFCSFSLRFSAKDNVVFVKITDVLQESGYELISLEIPSLIQSFDESAYLTNYYGGGRRINLKDADTQSFVFHYDVCNALGLCSKQKSFAVVANEMESALRQSVIKGGDGRNKGVIGIELFVHIKADKPAMKSIPAKILPIEIHYTPEESWQLSAEIMRDKMPKNFIRRYENTLIYKLGMDSTGQIDERNPETYCKVTTLKQAKDIILNIYGLSGGMKQVVYLVGWQKGGHDFEYPYPYISGFNPNCGTLDEFNQMREELKKYNVILSFHDNFDDAYLSDQYEINKDIISVNEKGEPWKGWLWAGGMSYIISPSDYLKTNDIKNRIETITNNYGIEKTYHLDVLTSEVRRYNFCQDRLSSADDNADAKCAIIEMFNEKDIDITSETLSFRFIGKIGYAHSTRYSFGAKLFTNETVLPLTTLAFHGVTPYRVGANTQKRSLICAIAAGASATLDAENSNDRTNNVCLCRNIYLATLPMLKLAYKKVVTASVRDSRWIMQYEDGGYVEVDFKAETYTIKSDGKIISKNFVTFMPMPTEENSYCYYSVDSGKAELEFPCDWEKVTIKALIGEKKEILTLNGGKLNYEFDADVPYILKKA